MRLPAATIVVAAAVAVAAAMPTLRAQAPQAPAPALTAFFPITPSRSYDTATLVEGKVHLDILAGREAVRGQAGGSEPITAIASDRDTPDGLPKVKHRAAVPARGPQ